MYIQILIYICFIKQTKTNKMTIFANLSNGNEAQIKVEGNQTQILNFIENYKGNDLGNDLVLEDFVTDFKLTGVVIEK